MLASVSARAARTLTSEDGYIRIAPNEWILGSAAVEKIVVFERNLLVCKSLREKPAGRDWVAGEGVSDEFFFTVGDDRISGASVQWIFVDTSARKLKQGELELTIVLERAGLRVSKYYVVHPGSSIIREWLTIANVGHKAQTIIEPGFLNYTVKPGEVSALDFLWMTGGENQPGSWQLKTEQLPPGKARVFNSYDSFPGQKPGFPGDGINAKIMLNQQQIWPAQGWQKSANASVTVPFDVTATVKKGDRLIFQVNMNQNIGWDTTAFDPRLAYEDGESHTASREFSTEQGRNGWRYQYLEGEKFVDLVYYPGPQQWRKEKDNATGTPFISSKEQHPDANQDAVRVWTAPKDGRLRITGTVCNVGNRENGMGPAGVRMGTSSYAPWNALFNRETKQGLFIGWDYFGHWASSYTQNSDGSVSVQFRVAGHKQVLEHGQSLTTPKAFVGLYRDDLDNAGNACLDWQYRYLWDYTREGWFPAVRALHFWWKGTGWQQPGVSWTGGNSDTNSLFQKILRVADFMRATGADVYHRDWGWWDCAGDWNGPDFRTMGDYLRKHGMGQLIYAFLYTVDAKSTVAQDHPDWLANGQTLDMSKPEVVEFIKGQLDMFAKRWGDFEWRNDSDPTSPRNGDDTPLLGQDQGLREILRSFLDKYPKCAFQAVNGGGNCVGYDYVRYASTIQFSDGAVGIIRNYWASLLLPPDKSNDQPDISNPDNFDKATWRGTLCCNFDTSGDTYKLEKLEGLRELNDIYHYLHKQGVVGRWVHVYRPIISGDDPTMYFERLSRDAKRGIIIPKRVASGAVTIRPKGLLPNESYLVSFQEAGVTQKRSGAVLMDKGIVLEKMLPGELVYLNLPLHPGSKLDTTPPTSPARLEKRRAENLGFPGVELEWRPGTDDNWVSYYEIFRDGTLIDKAAKGDYYFDHSAGADLAATYEARTVDGAGNVSPKVTAKGPKTTTATIIDDAPGSGVTFSANWQSRKEPAMLAHNGTITATKQKGATAELSFEGRRIIWFAKLGVDCGKVAVSIDGGEPEVVDTYCADDIWGAGIYQKVFPKVENHTLRLEVLGERGPRAKDCYVHVDGFRVENDK